MDTKYLIVYEFKENDDFVSDYAFVDYSSVCPSEGESAMYAVELWLSELKNDFKQKLIKVMAVKLTHVYKYPL